ncbi:MAG TPA: glycosyltransferase family 2 protein [Actinomycetota bacterium]|nr:glycosyltransferase family 2 protein [Actinomycetota bacterium]
MTAVRVLIAAHNESERVADTVVAARSIAGVDQVLVVDDGSTDGTAERARRSGAHVMRSPRRHGKGGVIERALGRIEPADVTMLLDADLGETAKEAAALLDAVLGGADVAIARLPRQPAHGGFRIVKRASALVIRTLCGFEPQEPMSGQRALTARALEVVRPLAPGFSMETAMTIDAVRAGLRVVEVPIPMTHAATGRDLPGVLHRVRQGGAVLRAAASRLYRRR